MGAIRMLRNSKSVHWLAICGVSIVALIFIGCGTTGGGSAARAMRDQAKLQQLQEASLRGPGPNIIRGESAKEFVWSRRWMIVPASNVTEVESNKIISVELKDHFGTATPVTADGYFLTAAHVVEHEAPVALNNMDARPARIVKRFPRADLALIKFPFEVRRYCEDLASEIEFGDFVYSDAAKGTVKPHGISPWRNGLRSIECDLPSGPGQSGGPIMNADGELIGVLVGAYLNRLTGQMYSETVANMIEPAMLRNLIEADRRASTPGDANQTAAGAGSQ